MEKNPYRTKMKPDELREYLAFKRKQGCVPAKKGKGSYNRKKLNNEKEWQKMKTFIYLIIEKGSTADYEVCFAFKDFNKALKKRDELSKSNFQFEYHVLKMELE